MEILSQESTMTAEGPRTNANLKEAHNGQVVDKVTVNGQPVEASQWAATYAAEDVFVSVRDLKGIAEGSADVTYGITFRDITPEEADRRAGREPLVSQAS